MTDLTVGHDRRPAAAGLVLAAALALACPACANAYDPAGLVKLEVGAPGEAPAWAQAELEMFAAYREAFAAFLQRCVEKPGGSLIVKVTNSGTADDISEGIAVWDRLLFVAGGEEARKAYVAAWKNIYEQLGEVRNGFRNGYYMHGYDAEHAAELLQHLWGAIELAPGDGELHRQNRIIADHLLAGQDGQTGLFKSLYLNNAGGSRRTAHWGRCSTHDFCYLNAWFHAWVATGQEKYRRAIFRFGEAWNRLAEKNDGVLPCVVGTTGDIPAEWWCGPFSYDRWGIPGIAQRGWHSFATMSVMLGGGETRWLSGLQSTVRALFRHGQAGRAATFFDGREWDATSPQARRRAYQLSHIVERLYDLTWSDEAAGWVKAAGSEYGRGLYFDGVSDDAAVGSFRRGAAKARQRTEALRGWRRLPRTGDELKRYSPGYGTGYVGVPYVDGNYWSIGYDNGRTGGVVNTPLRYFAGDGRIGLPEGVAALVRSVKPDAVALELYNANDRSVRVVLAAGHYGQHRFETINARKVGDARVLLELPGGALAKLQVRMARWRYRPRHDPLRPPGALSPFRP